MLILLTAAAVLGTAASLLAWFLQARPGVAPGRVAALLLVAIGAVILGGLAALAQSFFGASPASFAVAGGLGLLLLLEIHRELRGLVRSGALRVAAAR